MENEDYTAMFQGKEFAEFDKKLTEGLLEIEKKHIDFFKDRPGKYPYDKHDRLVNHRRFYKENHRFTFFILEDSDLPAQIKDEVILFVRELFAEYDIK